MEQGEMNRVTIALQFASPGYIGQPYWPARNTLININKEVHPKLSDAKKQSAILASCEKRGISPDEYQNLIYQAGRPFYTNGNGQIVIPERVFQSFINNASMAAPKAVPRVMSKGLTFIGIKIADGHLRTGKKQQDGSFNRFVKLEESNQRSWSESPFIENFAAEGILLVDPEVIKPDDLRKLLEWGGKWIGIGSARPQGFGRFQIGRWEEAVHAKVA
jgi:hypothetical protein